MFLLYVAFVVLKEFKKPNDQRGQRNAENIGCYIFRIIIIYVVNGKSRKRSRRKTAEDHRIGG